MALGARREVVCIERRGHKTTQLQLAKSKSAQQLRAPNVARNRHETHVATLTAMLSRMQLTTSRLLGAHTCQEKSKILANSTPRLGKLDLY